MHQTSPPQREKPPPPTPQRDIRCPRVHTDTKRTVEETLCPTRQREITKDEPHGENELHNIKKIVIALNQPPPTPVSRITTIPKEKTYLQQDLNASNYNTMIITLSNQRIGID